MSGKRSQAIGKTGEAIARLLLESAGVKMVERIATPIVVTGKQQGGWMQFAYAEKVSGDWRGMMPDGRRVLCEVKARDGRLRWSDLQPHQRRALDENHLYHGVSLLIWIHPDDQVILRWPVLGFGPRVSLSLDQAQQLQWDRST
jgi:hypothetical protein